MEDDPTLVRWIGAAQCLESVTSLRRQLQARKCYFSSNAVVTPIGQSLAERVSATTSCFSLCPVLSNDRYVGVERGARAAVAVIRIVRSRRLECRSGVLFWDRAVC